MELADSIAHMTQFTARKLSTILEKRAAHRGDDLAYRYLVSDRQEAVLTYADLWRRSEQMAQALRLACAPGDRALLVYPPGLEFITALFACVSANIIAVPLPFPRPGETVDRLVHVYRDCSPAIILTHGEGVTALRGLLSTELAKRLASSEGPFERSTSAGGDGGSASLRHIALLQYTSGTTAAPKGVMLSQANLVANLEQIRTAFGHTVDSSGVIWLPHHHDMGLIGGILQPLYVGFPVTLFAPAMFLQRPLRWLEAIGRYQATTSGGPCFAYDLCVEKALKKPDLSLDLASWAVAFNGAEPVRATTLDRFANVFKRHGFKRSAFVPCYGLAEATLLVTCAPVGTGDKLLAAAESGKGEPGAVRTLVSSGRPAPDVTVSVIDPDTGAQCADGVVGEVRVAGPAVSEAYWGEPPDLAAAPRSKRQIGTGDFGFLLDGELYVTGRVKDCIIIRGRNLAAEDVEEAMRSADPRLHREGCAAIAVAGEQGEELVLLQEISVRVLRNLNLAEIAQAVSGAVLQRCGVAPAAYVPVRTGALARTSSGKISRFANRKLYVEDGFAALVHRSSTVLESEERNPCSPSS
jgi:acyl-CoA synthetase (AMP-forming)/AMP-acid ligase II